MNMCKSSIRPVNHSFKKSKNNSLNNYLTHKERENKGPDLKYVVVG